jgi:alpha-ketoglutarate-dependent taurine dioxygenase
MEKAEQPKMKGFRRKAVDLSHVSLVKSRTMAEGETLPLVIEPATDNVDLADWARHNGEFIDQSLGKHGAILFRGFGLATVEDFERVATSICPELFGEYGDLPREGVSAKVYGSTPYPADQPILFHNESSHLPRWPMKQFFFSMIAAQKGGETPLLDCREIYKALDPAIRAAFEEKGLMYVRNFNGFDVPWHEFFRTNDKAEVERACHGSGMECEWTGDDTLRIRQRSRAVARHPKTREMVFFNQVQLHHASCIEAKTRESLRALFKEEEMPRNVYYGDGSPIEASVMDAITELYWEKAKMFPWISGDLIMVDNMLVAHARRPFEGPRKIVVAMGAMMNAKDLD